MFAALREDGGRGAGVGIEDGGGRGADEPHGDCGGAFGECFSVDAIMLDRMDATCVSASYSLDR